MSTVLQCWSASHPGVLRPVNEDACLCRPAAGLFAVADGVGGAGSGDVAATCAMQALSGIPDGLSAPDRLAFTRSRLALAHDDLSRRGRMAGNRTIATTIVVLLLDDHHFACLWAGDSRAYLLRRGVLLRLTADHSAVQEMLDEGRISERDAAIHPHANVITRALGSGPVLELDKVVGPVAADDRFLLCSDGLYKAVGEDEIGRILGEDGNAAERLVAAALAFQARDNVTAVVAVI
ncbi:MAG: serine/threonine-protein phosphatase [Gluconacetobacter diazotrophicus]|nr:serine/threonine-protein phosphatase [Gluconacetobacter diazotrophicus]